MKTKIVFCLLAAVVFVSSVSAQWRDRGVFNTWTTNTFSRALNYDADLQLKDVRVSKNKGYDRLVFEFTGGLPTYQVQYVRSGKFENTGEQIIRVGGSSFMDINLQNLAYPEDPKFVDVVIPKGNQHLPVFNEIKELEWFEGVRDFGLGLNRKRGFRVLELKDPFRLVIDFRQ